jgi:DNA-binding transcriptional LysR family regulator
MNINRLRYLVAVAETGSIRRAAELIGISPAAMSKAIKEFERETKLQLVIPAGRGIRVSDRGLEIARSARRALEELDQLERSIADTSERAAVVRIASFETFTTYFLGSLVDDALAMTPVHVVSAPPGVLEQNVADGVADIGVTNVPAPHAGLSHERVGDLDMCICARPGVVGSDLADIPFVVPVRPAGVGGPRLAADGWPVGVLRNERFRVGTMESALELCRRGVAAAYLPRTIVELHNEQVIDRFKLESTRPSELGNPRTPVYVVHRQADADVALFHRVATAVGALLDR